MNIQKKQQLKDGAMEVYVDAFSSGSVGQAIVNQEKRGQQQLVNSSKLPIKINVGKREQFEAMGIVYHDPVDDLFVSVTLPDGWKVEPTDHHMWSNLLDDKGRTRASIFYKAAFYDREAFLNVEQRFYAKFGPTCGWGSPEYHHNWPDWVGTVEDSGKEVWRSEPQAKSPFGSELTDLSRAWLDKHYPDWRDPLAYWG